TTATLHNLWLPMLLFASMGAITWAIRGTGGWGGIDGTIVPGLMWGVLWYYLCYRRGIDARGVALWLGMGIAFGGELGYGQYVGWMRAMFNVGDQIIPMAPSIGYAWFIIVGIGWGAPGGIALGWTLGGRTSLHKWLVRLLIPLGISLLARLLIQACPWLFFPNWDLGIYVAQSNDALTQAVSASTQRNMILAWVVGALLVTLNWACNKKGQGPRWLSRVVSLVALGYTVVLLLRMGFWLFLPDDNLGLFSGKLDGHLERTVYTNSQNIIIVAWWIGALLVAAVQKDRSTLTVGSLIGGGFGLCFMISALWCLGYSYAPHYIDWWKMWELNAGFNLGILYALALYWAIRQVDKTHDSNGVPLVASSQCAMSTVGVEWGISIASALCVCVLLIFTFIDGFVSTGILLGLFYTVALCWVMWKAGRTHDPNYMFDRRKSVSLTFSVFLFLFITFWGATRNLGWLLGIIDLNVDIEYSWPAWRIVIFTPMAILIIVAAIVHMWRIANPPGTTPQSEESRRLAARVADLMTVTGVVGAATIWPGKIGVMYVLFLCLAIFAFSRINNRFEEIDASPARGR
ncbi:MAG: hypothetical protein ABIH23_13810, partial [bacterium]